MQEWVWMRMYIESMLKYWGTVYYGGLAGWSNGDEEYDSTGGG